MLKFLLLFTALFLSGVAEYYSIIGLTAIFSGSFYSIVIMGVALGLAKLVAVSWLYRNWNKTPVFMKLYMTPAVFVLMLITSMGIFGFLSKAHLEQTANLGADIIPEISSLQSDIDIDNKIVSDVDKQLNLMDSTVKDYKILRRQNQQRKELQNTRKQAQERLRENSRKLAKLETEIKKIEVEVGPLKYIAELIYGKEQARSHFDQTVRWVIILLIFVFDPLAVMLLIAANFDIKNGQPQPKMVEKTVIRKRGRPRKTVEIDERSILNLEKYK